MSTKYEVIIYWSSVDDAFIAEVPELPWTAAPARYAGCIVAELFLNLSEVIGLVTENDSAPENLPEERLSAREN